MTTFTVRRLLIDLQSPLARHWAGGDAFRTAFFNALSMSFPTGEQVFIDSMRAAQPHLPPEEQERWADEIQTFIGQEATHRRVHQLFNSQLVHHGLVNRWEDRIRKRSEQVQSLGHRNQLAVTAATEHWTAILAEYLLSNRDVLAGAEPRLQTMWLWHSAEETEHRSTAFDLYRAVGGNEEWRLRVFRIVSSTFVIDTLRQTLNNLWHDGTWWRPSTWVGAWRFLFAKGGLVREGYGPWRRYLRSDFHPSQTDANLALNWLKENAALVPPVRSAA